MSIPLADLKAQYTTIKNEIDNAVRNVIENTHFILGPEVKAFESEMAAYCQTKFAVGVASGTDALHLTLLACDIAPGDEVITTPFTFIATSEAVTKCGATPVSVDIDPETYNIDPMKIESRINKKTRAILVVHLYGQSVDMASVTALGKSYNLKIIEDCAQSLGTKYKDSKVGSLGDAGCLSFFPSKVLGAYGDGGMVVTNNPEINEKVTMLRNHGAKQKYYHLVPGFNSRLDELQAAILRVKLKYLDKWIDLRQQKASLYSRLFGQMNSIKPPYVLPNTRHVFNYYTIRLQGSKFNRDKLQKHLVNHGIATAIYYPISLHLQQIYKALGYQPGDFPESEKAQEEVLSLPIYPELGDSELREIVRAFENYGK